MVDKEKLVYRTNEYIFDFRNFHTKNTFGREIYNSKIALKEADEDQSNLLLKLLIKKKKRRKIQRKSNRKKELLKNNMPFLRVEKEFLMLLIAK